MAELDSVVAQVQKDAARAESGDETAIKRLHDDVWSLSWQDRKIVADNIESPGMTWLFGGVTVDRDAINNVRSTTFSPSALARLEAWFKGEKQHSVRVTSSVVENYNASDSMYQSVRREYEQLPIGFRQILLNNHEVIGLGSTLKQANPAIGSTGLDVNKIDLYTSVRLGNEHRILVPEKLVNPDGTMQQNVQARNSMRYQVGVEVDEALKISQSDAFKVAVVADLSQAPEPVRQRMQPYANQQPNQPNSLFAEEVSLITRNANADIISQLDQDTAIYFRRTQQVVLARLSNFITAEQRSALFKMDSQFAKQPERTSTDPLTITAWKVEAEIADGQQGSQERLDDAGRDLGALSWTDRKTVAAVLEQDLGASTYLHPEGTKVIRDVIGNVRDIIFTPSSVNDPDHKLRSVRTPSPLTENYNSSDAYFKQVNWEVESLPPKVKEMLRDNYWVIATANKLLEGSPDLEKTGCEIPCDKAGGVTVWPESRIIMPENVKSDQGKWFRPDYVGENVRHEVGHSMDKLLGMISHRDDYLSAYNADRAELPEAMKKNLHYYLQDGWNGPQEAFAQIFSVISRPPGDKRGESDANKNLQKYFKRTQKVMSDALADYLKR